MAKPKTETVSDEEMVAEFKQALYKDLKAGKLGATALVTGLKTIQAMLPPAPPPVPVEDDRVNLLDKVGALPVPHARSLLKQEIARLGADLDAHVAALANLEGN